MVKVGVRFDADTRIPKEWVVFLEKILYLCTRFYVKTINDKFRKSSLSK